MESLPTISRILSDGTMIELLYEATADTTALAIRRSDGSIEKLPHLDRENGERLVPYSPKNNLIASGCVLLPSDIGEAGDVGDLVDDIRAYLRRYVDLTAAFMDVAPYYVLLSWTYDAFNELPYVRFRGSWGSGKTRALITVGSICYKPFFASGASTVSPIFHILDAFRGTLVLDEADFRFSDATADLTKVLNNGNVKGLPVLRTMTNRHRELNPQAFNVFGPKLVAMRESFSDDALESRFLTEDTGHRALPSHIPTFLPNDQADQALALRNRLLAWRFSAYAAACPNPDRIMAGARPRTNQMALPLLSVIDDVDALQRITEYLAGTDPRTQPEGRESDESMMVSALMDAFEKATQPHVSVAAVAQLFNIKSRGKLYLPLSNKSVGSVIRKRLGIATMKSRGIYVVPQSERSRIAALGERYGIAPDARDTGETSAPA